MADLRYGGPSLWRAIFRYGGPSLWRAVTVEVRYKNGPFSGPPFIALAGRWQERAGQSGR